MKFSIDQDELEAEMFVQDKTTLGRLTLVFVYAIDKKKRANKESNSESNMNIT